MNYTNNNATDIFRSLVSLYFNCIVCAQNHKESKMVLFEKENFMGRQWEINDDYPSLQAMGWGNNEIGSMQVQSGS